MNENLQQSIKQSVNRRLVYEIHFHNPDENPSFSADTNQFLLDRWADCVTAQSIQLSVRLMRNYELRMQFLNISKI